jgi:hypothetical protein
MAALGEHHDDRVADQANLIRAKRGEVRAAAAKNGIMTYSHTARWQKEPLELFTSKDGNYAIFLARRLNVDLQDSPMSGRAADEGRVQRSGGQKVVDESAVAGQNPAVFQSLYWRSDISLGERYHACPFLR